MTSISFQTIDLDSDVKWRMTTIKLHSSRTRNITYFLFDLAGVFDQSHGGLLLETVN